MTPSTTGALNSITTKATATLSDSVGNITATSEGEGVWPEFREEMCQMLNSTRCLLVAAAPKTALSVCRCIDDVCSKLYSHMTDDNNTTATTTNSNNHNSEDNVNATLLALQNAPRVIFTTGENISKLQKCTAVYGRTPMFVVMEMERDHFFVLDLPENGNSNESAASKLEEEVETFLRGVANGSVPTALQGDAPPENDRFEPSHGVTLTHGLCAVTSTIARLKRERPGGAVCVFWSTRCGVCPAVIMTVDLLVGMILTAAARHGVERPFNYFICTIDSNDLLEYDWSGPCTAQMVPTIAVYNGVGERMVYRGKRTAALLVAFICDHCLAHHLVDTAVITAEVMESVGKLSEDELWERHSLSSSCLSSTLTTGTVRKSADADDRTSEVPAVPRRDDEKTDGGGDISGPNDTRKRPRYDTPVDDNESEEEKERLKELK